MSNYKLIKMFLKYIILIVSSLSLFSNFSLAQSSSPIKIGLMLPYSGTYSAIGIAIANGFKLAVNENGGKIAGREIEYVILDDESDPSKAIDNANKLIKRDKVDLIIGTVHSGVAIGLAKVAKENNTLLIVPNAGANELTGVMCGPTIFRSSFSNWQPSYSMGEVLAKENKKTAVTLTWKYAGGEQMVAGFKESYEKNGGKVIKEMYLPFPNVEFQALLTEIAALKPSAVYVFFAGSGGVKFVKDYAAVGLKNSIPLYATGFLTDGTLEAQGDAAKGLITTLHYGDDLNTPKNISFRKDYAIKYKLQPDVYAVQGYDAAQLFIDGMKSVNGDLNRRSDLIKALENAKINSPRGNFKMSKSHNPIQDIYLRKVDGVTNKVIGIASKGLDDPAVGCKLE
jgi:branched-chain amino acid transport system substrate-binding protein